MNALKDKTVLVIWNSALTNLAAQIAAQAAIAYSVGDGGTVTTKNMSGVTEAQQLTWLGTLVDSTYDHIFMFVDIDVAGYGTGSGTGKMTFDGMVILKDKLITASKVITVITSGTAQAGANTTITLATSASATNDTYNKMVCHLTAGTGIGGYRWFTDYVGSTKVASIDASKWDTNPDNTTHYEVGYMVGLHQFYVADANGLNCASRTWSIAYPDATMPLVIKYVAGGGFAVCSGTAQSYTSGTKTLVLPASITTGDRSTGHATNDYYNGKYAYIYSATTGQCQYKKITDYVGSSKSAVLESDFDVALTGTIVIRVMDDTTELFNDVCMKLAIECYLSNPDNTDWALLFDSNGMLNNYINRAPIQDRVLLADYLDKGMAIYKGLTAGISAVPV